MRWLELTYSDKRRTVLEFGASDRGAGLVLCYQIGDGAGFRTLSRAKMLDCRLAPAQWSQLPDSILLEIFGESNESCESTQASPSTESLKPSNPMNTLDSAQPAEPIVTVLSRMRSVMSATIAAILRFMGRKNY